MRFFIPAFFILAFSLTSTAQKSADSILFGKWILSRWDNNNGRLLDFDDSTFTIKSFMASYRQNKRVQTIPVTDSLAIVEEFRKALPGMNNMRFEIGFNPDHTFWWKGSFFKAGDTISGDFELSMSKEIILKILNEETKQKEDMKLPVLVFEPGKLVIKIPHPTDQVVASSLWTLRKQ